MSTPGNKYKHKKIRLSDGQNREAIKKEIFPSVEVFKLTKLTEYLGGLIAKNPPLFTHN